MKVLLSWIFDHIEADWRSVDVPKLVYNFNQKVAEIEQWFPLNLTMQNYFLARVTQPNDQTIAVDCPELGITMSLPFRSDAQRNQLFLIKKEDDSFSWVSSTDFSHTKQFLLPALSCHENDLSGNWKKQFAGTDYVLDIDNKSITHRPDLWSHAGLAREIAAFLNLPLKNLASSIADIPQDSYESENSKSSSASLSVAIQDRQHCKRLAALLIKSIENKPSLVHHALRLTCIDAKPINAIVDITNYVMFDIGQPMHAFDADQISEKTVIARHAAPGEKLRLLDGAEIALDSSDLIIADTKKPLALAGIMGGAQSAITLHSSSVILEAACFDATAIRHAAARHKIRTEASARFEKTLDPNQNTRAINRFIQILKDEHISFELDGPIISLGSLEQPKIITMSHDLIEKKLGTSISQSFITQTGERLGFVIADHDGEYRIEIPTWRASKDIAIAEDFIEEIGRIYGYSQIKTALPYKPTQVHDLTPVIRRRSIKQHLAYGLRMQEISSYALFDEHFLQQLQWEPSATITVKNPVSDNWRRLVNSLVPNLLKAVSMNSNNYDSLHFFESARTWKIQDPVKETKQIAGIFFEKKNSIDFYQAKNELSSLFDLLKLSVAWFQDENPEHPWYMPYQTAYLKVEDTIIGRAGKVHQQFLHRITEGDAFIFELDADYLISFKEKIQHYKAPSKYPFVQRDISVLIAKQYTVHQIIEHIAKTDTAISDVLLIDFFEKKEWGQLRSLTFRFTISDETKTLTKNEADVVYERVAENLREWGATIR